MHSSHVLVIARVRVQFDQYFLSFSNFTELFQQNTRRNDENIGYSHGITTKGMTTAKNHLVDLMTTIYRAVFLF